MSLEAQEKLEKDTAKKEAKAEAKADAALKKKMVRRSDFVCDASELTDLVTRLHKYACFTRAVSP